MADSSIPLLPHSYSGENTVDRDAVSLLVARRPEDPPAGVDAGGLSGSLTPEAKTANIDDKAANMPGWNPHAGFKSAGCASKAFLWPHSWAQVMTGHGSDKSSPAPRTIMALALVVALALASMHMIQQHRPAYCHSLAGDGNDVLKVTDRGSAPIAFYPDTSIEGVDLRGVEDMPAKVSVPEPKLPSPLITSGGIVTDGGPVPMSSHPDTSMEGAHLLHVEDVPSKLSKLTSEPKLPPPLIRPALSGGCDIYDGQWVKDTSYPLYQGQECRWIAKNWACRFGAERPSFAFENYRWQPRGCDIPRFNASDFLERMRNKVVAFVGDSLGQQHFQSMLCLLAPEGPPPEPDKTPGKEHPTSTLPNVAANGTSTVVDVGTQHGFFWAPGTRRPTGWAYLFPATNTTLLFKWSTCLCLTEPVDRSNASAGLKMHLDRPDEFLRQHLGKVNLLILNTGHHWNRVKLKDHHFWINGSAVPAKPRRRQDVVTMWVAHELAVRSVAKWMDAELQRRSEEARAAGGVGGAKREGGPLVMMRARSPRHFLEGEWNTGGRCDHLQAPLSDRMLKNLSLGDDPVVRNAVAAVPVRPGQAHSVQFLNISFMSSSRGDAHPSKWDFRGTSEKGQDCLHWCLPGVPDNWNELVYAKLVLHQQKSALQAKNSVANHGVAVHKRQRERRGKRGKGSSRSGRGKNPGQRIKKAQPRRSGIFD